MMRALQRIKQLSYIIGIGKFWTYKPSVARTSKNCRNCVHKIIYFVHNLSPNSSVLTNSSSVKASSLALSICIFCLFKTSINFIYFLNAYRSSFLCRSSFLLSSDMRSRSRLIYSFLLVSSIFDSLTLFGFISNQGL
jgi:hypothetical protein